jgi:hypothetical protein
MHNDIINENRKLKHYFIVMVKKIILKHLKKSMKLIYLIAQRDYKEAYDSGDSQKLIDAQTKMNAAQYSLGRVQEMRPQYKVDETTFQPKVVKPDDKALAWQAKNSWFGKDQEMTSLALGLHEKLVSTGVDPMSDRYYRRIDETMQKRFPEYFGESDDSLEDKPAQRKPSTVVAPATRSTAPKKVRLTKTQLALAKKFKLTPEQYARELIKTENANG